MKICPVCVKEISNWAMATGKTIKVNNITYHKTCIADKSIADLPKREK